MSAKNDKFGYLNPILGKLGVMHDLGWWLIGKPMVNFLIALLELFSLSIKFRSCLAKCVQLGCFHRGLTSLHSDFTWTGSSLISHFWREKTRDTGLPDGENCILLRSLVLTQCRSVTDRQMDRQTDRYAARSIYRACKASFAARCNN